MKLSILVASTLFFTFAQSAPVTTDAAVGPTDRHIIRHTHKINCRNCFCGYKAIERARHACPADRDLILCPPSIPVRACYRCACYQRIPVSPSPFPPMVKPHPKHDFHQDDDMMKETPDADDDLDVTSSAPTHTKKPHPTKKPQPAKKPYPTMKPHPTVMKKKPDSTTMPKLTKKPHPTMKAEQEKKSHKTMPSKPTKKIHPTMMSKPSKNPHPTKQSGAQTPTPSTKGCASFQRGGGGGFTMFDVDLLESHGTFKISWQMDTIPDMIEIFYEDKKIFTTKVPVSGHGSAYAKYSGKSTKIRVWVTSPTSGTGWFLMIGCANDKH